MVHVLVRHKVADYNRWKQAFDSHLNTRKHAGETGVPHFSYALTIRAKWCCSSIGRASSRRASS